jgi:hypothetical protein
MQTIPYTSFSDIDIRDTQPAMKVGLLATINPDGLPHVTLLASLMACDPGQLCFGQFTEGMSKAHLLTNPHAGFLIMSLDKNMWRGKASYTHSVKNGKEYDFYNNVPMFRYNAYFGIHTVHYLDLVAHTGKMPLPMSQVIFGAVQTRLGRTLGRKLDGPAVLNDWTRSFLNKIDNLKFLAYVGTDGFPVIIPAIQTQCLDRQHAIFSTPVFTQELLAIPAGVPIAVFCMALTMEDVLLRGKYLGIQRVGGIKAGIVEVEWVYNPMPPVPGQVYPPVELKAVEQF